MDPRAGRVAFNIAILLVLLSALPLFFIDPNSAGFVVGTIALIFSLIFLTLVVWEVRRQAKMEEAFRDRA